MDSTWCSFSTRQTAAIRSSSISDSATSRHQPIPLRLEPSPLACIERPLPLGQNLVVSVLFRELHPQVEPCPAEQPVNAPAGAHAAGGATSARARW